jgi:hypothetical protein
VRNGLIAGAVGTVTLNGLTYVDQVVRAREASTMPEEMAGTLAHKAGIALGENEEIVERRKQGLGPLLGILVGLSVACGYGVLRERGVRLPVPVSGLGVGLAASAVSDTPMAALRLTDPRSWSMSGWLTDLVPHVVFGLTVAAVYERIRRS